MYAMNSAPKLVKPKITKLKLAKAGKLKLSKPKTAKSKGPVKPTLLSKAVFRE